MQFKVYGDAGKSTLYPLLLDIIGLLNHCVVIPLLPLEKYPAGQRPDPLIPLIRLTDGKDSRVCQDSCAYSGCQRNTVRR